MLGMQDGYSVSYLTDAVGGGREGYYTDAAAAGEPPGLWYGRGAETLGLTGEVDAEVMKAIYAQVLDPRDPTGNGTLGKPWRQYRSAEQRYAESLKAAPDASAEEREQLWVKAQQGTHHAKAFYDATFSPAKSVSVLGVAFERQADLARQAGNVEAAQHWATMHKAVEDAVMAGARASMDYLQEKAGYSRVGRNGKEWVDAHQFVVAQFLQHDSRDRDPQLHVHQAILNKVLCPDGQWRSIDNNLLWEWKAAAAAIGERTMEAYLEGTVGVRFETRPDGFAREIRGVPPELCDEFSSRSHDIGPRTQELIQEYRDKHGREPNAITQCDLAQQATLETRAAKSHHGEDHVARAARWAEQAQRRRDGGLEAVAGEALAAGKTTAPAARWEVRDVIERAVARLSQSQQSWTESDAMLAVSNELPGHLGVRPEDIRELLEGLTAATLDAAAQRLTPEASRVPKDAQLANGMSNMKRPSPTRYASEGLLVAEAALRKATAGRTGVALSTAEAARIADRFAESGHELGADQRAALIGVLTSGAGLETISAAAGAGKSFLTGAIAQAWQEAGLGRVYGLSPYEVATGVLRDEGLTARNVAAWLATQERLAAGRGLDSDADFRLRPGDLVVVDEAETLATPQLAAVHKLCEQAGAKPLCVGDPNQLAAVGAGGMFADIAQHGVNYQLTEVRRFEQRWEVQASLGLRAGDKDALAEYDRHGRLRDGGTVEQARQKATQAWLADTLAGKESLLLVGANAEADKAAAELRAELVKLGKVEEAGVWLGRQGTTAGVGDLIQGRHNAWDLKGWQGNTAAPINWQTYRVTGLRADGGLSVTDIKTGTALELPPEYVAKDVRLGYAATVHSALGRTVDTAHAVAGPGMDAKSLYVALTRGQQENTAWTVTDQQASEAGPDAAPVSEPRSARAVLADRLEAAAPDLSASAEKEQLLEQDRAVTNHGELLIDYAQRFTASRVAATLDTLAATGQLSERDRLALAADDSMWSLEHLLRGAELAGHDLEQVLADAVTGADFTTAHHPAQALYGRIEHSFGGRPTSQITSAEDLIPRNGINDEWRDWFTREAEAVDDRRRELAERLAEDAPPWLTELIGHAPDDPIARAQWEHRAGWAGLSRELLGHTDDLDALGTAPRPGLVDKRAVWDTAAEAVRLPDCGPDEREASNGLLRMRVRAYEREKAWAPANVDSPLAATSQALADARTAASLATARAEAATAIEDKTDLAAQAAAAHAQAAALAVQVEQLTEAADVRGQWFVDSAVTREAAYRAKAMLESRGVALDDPEDQTTAAELLAAYRAEQAAEDEYREIHAEYELVDDAGEETPTIADTPETAVADIRETAVPDAFDAEQPAQKRRVLTVDETAAAVDRAREALAEQATRREWEQSQGQAAEARRSEELARWAADDRAAQEAEAAQRDDDLVAGW